MRKFSRWIASYPARESILAGASPGAWASLCVLFAVVFGLASIWSAPQWSAIGVLYGVMVGGMLGAFVAQRATLSNGALVVSALVTASAFTGSMALLAVAYHSTWFASVFGAVVLLCAHTYGQLFRVSLAHWYGLCAVVAPVVLIGASAGSAATLLWAAISAWLAIYGGGRSIAQDRIQSERELVTELIKHEEAHHDQAQAAAQQITSHELKNNLHQIGGIAEVLMKAATKSTPLDEAPMLWEGLIDAVDSAGALVSDALQTSLVDGPGEYVTLSLEAVISEVWSRYALIHDVTLSIEGSAQVLAPNRDVVALVINNALSNAIEGDGMRGATRITATITRTTSLVDLIIEDDGPGFPASVLVAPLGTMTSTKRRGHGIGRHAMARCIALCGGSLEMSNLPEGGARVAFTLRPGIDHDPKAARA